MGFGRRIRRLAPYVMTLLAGGIVYGVTFIPILNRGALQDFVGTLAQVLSGVLGFTVSVVAIVVQLSADRFTPKVTELFLRERINQLMILFLIVATLISVWTASAFSLVAENGLPFWLDGLVALNLLLGTLSIVLLIPYFGFVFNFLRPASIIHSIEAQIRQSVRRAFQKRSVSSSIALAHRECLSLLDEIKAIALSAVEQKESLILLNALETLKDFTLFYVNNKRHLAGSWFLLSDPICQDPDFVSVDLSKLYEIENQKVWLELKLLRQYQEVFNDSINEFREACYIVSINTRKIAEHVIQCQNFELLSLIIKFFNNYLRTVLNASDVRTGYIIIKQYRHIAECSLRYNCDAIVRDIADHFRYYSLLAYKREGLRFLCETFAFDLSALARSCFPDKVALSENILQILLKIDQDPDPHSEQQVNTSLGVRQSQMKLAAFYLQNGKPDLAYLIYKDMKEEPFSRLEKIYEALCNERADFREFTDRGESFYYVEPNLIPFLADFYHWFSHPPIL